MGFEEFYETIFNDGNWNLIDVQAEEIDGHVDGLDLADLDKPVPDVLGGFGEEPDTMVDRLTDDRVQV